MLTSLYVSKTYSDIVPIQLACLALEPVPLYMEKTIRKLPMFHDADAATELGLTNDVGQPLVMP